MQSYCIYHLPDMPANILFIQTRLLFKSPRAAGATSAPLCSDWSKEIPGALEPVMHFNHYSILTYVLCRHTVCRSMQLLLPTECLTMTVINLYTPLHACVHPVCGLVSSFLTSVCHPVSPIHQHQSKSCVWPQRHKDWHPVVDLPQYNTQQSGHCTHTPTSLGQWHSHIS